MKYLSIEIVIIYILIINLCGFLSMYIDKRRAISHKWRIKEKTLFIFALLGGALGSIVGMYTFRHKTKHWYFVIDMPLIFIAETICAALIYSMM